MGSVLVTIFCNLDKIALLLILLPKTKREQLKALLARMRDRSLKRLPIEEETLKHLFAILTFVLPLALSHSDKLGQWTELAAKQIKQKLL